MPFPCLVGLAVYVQLFSPIWLFMTPWTLSMEFPRQEYWSGLPFPSPGDLPDPGIKLESPVLAGRFFTTELSGKLRRELIFHPQPGRSRRSPVSPTGVMSAGSLGEIRLHLHLATSRPSEVMRGGANYQCPSTSAPVAAESSGEWTLPPPDIN